MTKKIDILLNYALFVVLATMASVMAINVLCRFLLNYPIYWADELTQSLMLWLTFLGAAVAIREHSHYSFNYIEEHLNGKMKTAFALTNRIIVLITVCLLLYWSTEVTVGIANWIMPTLMINRAWVYGACPIGCIFMLYYCVKDLVTYFKK